MLLNMVSICYEPNTCMHVLYVCMCMYSVYTCTCIVYACIYHVAMVTTGLTPLYIHLSKIQHSV